MRIYLIANSRNKEKERKCLYALSALSMSHSLSIDPLDPLKKSFDKFEGFSPMDADLILSIGGDGTLLHASHLAYRLGKPLFGVNAGHLGALTACKIEEIDADDLLKGYRLEDRYGVEFESNTLSGFALNEVVVASYSRAKSTRLGIECGEKEFTLRGDGILFASPTGSNAYNASLGGPLLRCDDPSSILLPLAPIGAKIEAILIKQEEEVVVRPLDITYAKPVLVYDGIEVGNLSSPIALRRSRRPLKLYKKFKN